MYVICELNSDWLCHLVTFLLLAEMTRKFLIPRTFWLTLQECPLATQAVMQGQPRSPWNVLGGWKRHGVIAIRTSNHPPNLTPDFPRYAGSLPSPVVRSHNPVVTIGSYQVIIDNWIVTTAPLNTAPQDIDFETYENYKEIGWKGHCNLTIQ